MHMPFRARTAVRAALLVIWGSLSFMAVAAPYCAAHSLDAFAATLYLFFAPVCHQDPGRCFSLGGYSWALCHRCSGIYFGTFLASLSPLGSLSMLRSPGQRRMWVIGASAPLLLDALLPYIGVWINTPWSRFSSGLLFGVMLSTLLLPGLTEFLEETLWRGPGAHASILVGGTLWTRKEC